MADSQVEFEASHVDCNEEPTHSDCQGGGQEPPPEPPQPPAIPGDGTVTLTKDGTSVTLQLTRTGVHKFQIEGTEDFPTID